MCSKHPFQAMFCPVNMSCDRDVSCVVSLLYHVLISVQLVSYVATIQCTLRAQKYGNDGLQQHKNVLSNSLIFLVVFDAILVQNSIHKLY